MPIGENGSAPWVPSAASGMLVQSLYALTEYKLERARTPRLIMHQDPNQAIQTVLTETRLCHPEPLDTTTPHISNYQLTAHLHDFINAYNYGRRLKTLRGLTPYEYICKCWTSEPQRFTLNPHHQILGPNT